MRLKPGYGHGHRRRAGFPSLVAGSITSAGLQARDHLLAATTPLKATVRDVNNREMKGTAVSWSSDQPLTASVSQSGVVTGLAPG